MELQIKFWQPKGTPRLNTSKNWVKIFFVSRTTNISSLKPNQIVSFNFRDGAPFSCSARSSNLPCYGPAYECQNCSNLRDVTCVCVHHMDIFPWINNYKLTRFLQVWSNNNEDLSSRKDCRDLRQNSQRREFGNPGKSSQRIVSRKICNVAKWILRQHYSICLPRDKIC